MKFTQRFWKTTFSALLTTILFAAQAAAAPSTLSPEEAFRRTFPQVRMDGIRETDIKGIYEVISGPNIYYYFQERDYLFSGSMFNKNLVNLTAERMGGLMAESAKSLPREKAVRIGNGRKTVVEITDPDCDFCRNASRYFAARKDLTRYIFFAPLTHPEAIRKVQYILGAADKAHAYEEMMAGKEIPQDAPAAGEDTIALAREHLSLAKKIGVRATPTFFIEGRTVVGADIAKIEQLLKE